MAEVAEEVGTGWAGADWKALAPALSKYSPTALAKVMEEAEGGCPLHRWSQHCVARRTTGKECARTAQGKGKTKGKMKDIKYWCARQNVSARLWEEGKQRVNKQGSGESQHEP